MPRTLVLLLATAIVSAAPSASWPADSTVIVHDFSTNPLEAQGSRPVFLVTGDPAAFVHEPDAPARFSGDLRGSLRVELDSLAPTSRLATPLPEPFGPADDFVLGALLTIRPGIEADPFGFHPIAFSLFNSLTTGDDRTGDLDDFRADTFDTFEMAYFPNVSPFFGGPYLAATAFGFPRGDDAFTHIAFASVPQPLQPGVTYLIQLHHAASLRGLVLRVWRAGADGRLIELPPARVECDLSSLEGFLLDSAGIPTYHDGFNVFAASGRSLRATVDYDLLYAARLEDGRVPAKLAAALGRLRFARQRLFPESPLP